MRLCASLMLTALLAASVPASADTAVYVDSPGTVLLRLDGVGNLLAWPATPGAFAYKVYRVAPDGEATHLGTSLAPSFLDSTAMAGEEIVYRVVALTSHGEGQVVELATKGECIARRGITGVAITLSNCARPVEQS